MEFARSYLSNPVQRKIDVVFLSPPWGGPEYISGDNLTSREGDQQNTHPEFSLASIKPIHGTELFTLTRRITRNVAYFLPRNTNLQEISDLLLQSNAPSPPQEVVKVEEEWMGSKLKALTCYFGGLAVGQEDLFEQGV